MGLSTVSWVSGLLLLFLPLYFSDLPRTSLWSKAFLWRTIDYHQALNATHVVITLTLQTQFFQGFLVCITSICWALPSDVLLAGKAQQPEPKSLFLHFCLREAHQYLSPPVVQAQSPSVTLPCFCVHVSLLLPHLAMLPVLKMTFRALSLLKTIFMFISSTVFLINSPCTSEDFQEHASLSFIIRLLRQTQWRQSFQRFHSICVLCHA